MSQRPLRSGDASPSPWPRRVIPGASQSEISQHPRSHHLRPGLRCRVETSQTMCADTSEAYSGGASPLRRGRFPSLRPPASRRTMGDVSFPGKRKQTRGNGPATVPSGSGASIVKELGPLFEENPRGNPRWRSRRLVRRRSPAIRKHPWPLRRLESASRGSLWTGRRRCAYYRAERDI
jgi:hypothetical protein